MYPSNNRYRRPGSKPKKLASPKAIFVAALLIASVIILGGGFFLMQNKKDAAPGSKDVTEQIATFDKQKHSLTDPASQWVVVNKKRPLEPKQYEPLSLRTPDIDVESSSMQVNEQAAVALEALVNAASAEGVKLTVASAYRSYPEQTTIYNSMVKGYGQEEADRQSARPGYSEHQTGWAADLGASNGTCRIETCFADTREGKWLAANAHKHGFIIRYPKDKESVTGYNYEPWHVRFVGIELSTEMHNQKIETLEEFFNLPTASNY